MGSAATSYRAGWEETKHDAETALNSLTTLAESLGVVATTHSDLDTSRTTTTSSLDLPAV